jgi:hypothetical protein
VRVNTDAHEEISASVAAHAELGPRYDAAVAEGLIERIGEEIDRRVDARLRASGQAPAGAPPAATPAPGAFAAPGYPGPSAPPSFAMPPVPAAYSAPPVPQRRLSGVPGMILGLGSIGIGVGATSAVVSHQVGGVAQTIMVLLIWVAIAIVNIAHSRRS